MSTRHTVNTEGVPGFLMGGALAASVARAAYVPQTVRGVEVGLKGRQRLASATRPAPLYPVRAESRTVGEHFLGSASGVGSATNVCALPARLKTRGVANAVALPSASGSAARQARTRARPGSGLEA